VPRRYPAEFRRKVLGLVEAGRPVAQVARDLDISAQCIYTWRKQLLIDRGQLPGITNTDQAERVCQRPGFSWPRTSWSRRENGSPSWRTSWRSTAGRQHRSAMWCPQKAVRGHHGDGRRPLHFPAFLNWQTGDRGGAGMRRQR
jgi:hypothetical protein